MKYTCPLCNLIHNIVTTDKEFLFFHLKNKHLFSDIVNKVNELKIVNKSYRESKTSLIYALIDHSVIRSMY